MKYISTRNSSKEFNFSEVFMKGLAKDGGLFIPKTKPKLSNEELLRFSKLSYQDLAKEIIFLFCNETVNKKELSNIISLNINENNKFSFETKKNYKTDSTEFYDINYEYINDCLTAGLLYRREFYEDSDTDVKPKDSLMFMITFVPFGGVKTPDISP